MLCRSCSSQNTRVTCTDKYETFTKRYCRCLDCGHKFRTVEKYEFPKPGPAKNCPRPGRIAKGSAHGSAILTEKDVLEMRRLRKTGWTLQELRDKFGMSSSYISRIVNYKQWTHVP